VLATLLAGPPAELSTAAFPVGLSAVGLATLLSLGSLLVLRRLPPSLLRLPLLSLLPLLPLLPLPPLLFRPRLTTELPALLVLVPTFAPNAPTTALPVPPDVAARTLRAFA